MATDLLTGANTTLLSSEDLHLFNEGTHSRIYEKLGAHLTTVDGEAGTRFAVWAPNAREISMVGSFNGWNPRSHILQTRGASGIWEGFIPNIGKGTLYKFHIVSNQNGYVVDKADPFGVLHEEPPRTASVVWDLDYQWSDAEWLKGRGGRNSLRAPISIY